MKVYMQVNAINKKHENALGIFNATTHSLLGEKAMIDDDEGKAIVFSV